MKARTWLLCRLPAVSAVAFASFILFLAVAVAAPKPGSYWSVDDVLPGMKGYGRTVMHGTKIENFDAEVLGVLKNTSPGRDMFICRLSANGDVVGAGDAAADATAAGMFQPGVVGSAPGNGEIERRVREHEWPPGFAEPLRHGLDDALAQNRRLEHAAVEENRLRSRRRSAAY